MFYAFMKFSRFWTPARLCFPKRCSQTYAFMAGHYLRPTEERMHTFLSWEIVFDVVAGSSSVGGVCAPCKRLMIFATVRRDPCLSVVGESLYQVGQTFGTPHGFQAIFLNCNSVASNSIRSARDRRMKSDRCNRYRDPTKNRVLAALWHRSPSFPCTPLIVTLTWKIALLAVAETEQILHLLDHPHVRKSLLPSMLQCWGYGVRTKEPFRQ